MNENQFCVQTDTNSSVFNFHLGDVPFAITVSAEDSSAGGFDCKNKEYRERKGKITISSLRPINIQMTSFGQIALAAFFNSILLSHP